MSRPAALSDTVELHLRPAARAGRSLPRHPGRGAGGRRHPAHVRDIAKPDTEAQAKADVEKGAAGRLEASGRISAAAIVEGLEQDRPRWPLEDRGVVEGDARRAHPPAITSAVTGELFALLNAISALVDGSRQSMSMRRPGRARRSPGSIAMAGSSSGPTLGMESILFQTSGCCARPCRRWRRPAPCASTCSSLARAMRQPP